MQLDKKEIGKFQKEILDWYGKNKRDLPWRRPSLKLRNGKTRDPYAILISEIMLQQTQVSRVIPKFEVWMKRFPTIFDLSKASTRDVLLYWSGLGYNRRVLYLKRLAEEVVKNSNGMFSQDEKELKKLPGIGEYTARAILCFAFNKQVAVVDTNVRKVILLKILNRHPEFISGSQTRIKKQVSSIKEEKMLKQVQHDKKTIQEIADQLLPQGRAYDWNQALMDYAAGELKKETLLRSTSYGRAKKSLPFKDSDRYYRGQILKILLGKKRITKKELLDNFKVKVEEGRLEKILQGLEKDKFIKREKEGIILLKDGKVEFP